MLVLPALGAAWISADGFSATTVLNRGILTDASALVGARERFAGEEETLPLPGESPGPVGMAGEIPGPPLELPRDERGRLKVELIDLLFGTQDETVRRDFENREVSVIGQLMEARELNPGGDRMKLIRMFMVCCAADARPVAVLFRKPEGLALPEMSWVRVNGRVTYPFEGGSRIVLIEPAEVAPSDPPEESMLF